MTKVAENLNNIKSQPPKWDSDRARTRHKNEQQWTTVNHKYIDRHSQYTKGLMPKGIPVSVLCLQWWKEINSILWDIRISTVSCNVLFNFPTFQSWKAFIHKQILNSSCFVLSSNGSLSDYFPKDYVKENKTIRNIEFKAVNWTLLHCHQSLCLLKLVGGCRDLPRCLQGKFTSAWLMAWSGEPSGTKMVSQPGTVQIKKNIHRENNENRRLKWQQKTKIYFYWLVTDVKINWETSSKFVRPPQIWLHMHILSISLPRPLFIKALAINNMKMDR